MKHKISLLGVLVGLLIYSGHGYAGNTGYEFLRTHVGARPAAMGGAFLTVTNDVHAAYYNPSALATLQSNQLTFSYLNYFLDFQSGFAAYGFQIPDMGHFGIGTHYLNYGEFEQTDELGNVNGEFGAANLVFITDYAVQFAPDFYLGVAFKFINSRIADYTSNAIAADFGLLYRFPEHDLQIGFGVFNYGSVIDAYVESKEQLPQNYKLGVSKRLAHLPLLLCVQGYQYKGEDPKFIIGGEFALTPFLFLRLSYNSIGSDQKIGQNGDKYAGLSIGTGISLDQTNMFQNSFWKNFRFDYAFTSAGEVGHLNRLSITLRL